MSTNNIALKNVPVQITDGTKYATIQSLNDKNFRWCESDTLPSKNAYQFSTKLNVGLGARIWIWNPSINDTNEMPISYTIVGE